MPTVFMTKGLPGSGKDTWAEKEIAHRPGKVKRINKDMLRDMLDNGKWSKSNERCVLQLRDVMIENLLLDGYDVIVTDTNLHHKHQQQISDIIKKMATEHYIQADMEIVDFTDMPIDICIQNDLKRNRSVGEAVIRNMAYQFQVGYEEYQPPEGRPEAILVDLDGTLAHSNGRSPYAWDRVGEDSLDESVAMVIDAAVANGYEIILLSGRDGVARKETQRWLSTFNIPYDRLFMRRESDNRKDYIVKREIFDQEIRDNWKVNLVIDDRLQVVDMWRQAGLTVWQVAEGRF